MQQFITMLKEKFQKLLDKKDFRQDLERLPAELSKEEIYKIAYINGFWAGTTESIQSLGEMNQ